jgi:hypothetical protein
VTAGSVASAAAVGAIGAAAGSIASQLVGMAIGMQDKFSWKSVGQAALGGAISGGIGNINAGGGALRAAANGAMSAGLNLAIRGDWSWRQVAGAALGAAASAQLARTVGYKLFDGSDFGKTTGQYVGQFAGAVASSRVIQGKVDYRSAFAQTLGYALGDGVANVLGAEQAGRRIGGTLRNSLIDAARPEGTGAVFNLDLADVDAEAHVAATNAQSKDPWFTDEEIEAGTRRSPGKAPSLSLKDTAALGSINELAAEVAENPAELVLSKKLRAQPSRPVAKHEESTEATYPRGAGAGRGFINPPTAAELNSAPSVSPETDRRVLVAGGRDVQASSNRDLVGGSAVARGMWQRMLERVDAEAERRAPPFVTEGRESRGEVVGALFADAADEFHDAIMDGRVSPGRPPILGASRSASRISAEMQRLQVDALRKGMDVHVDTADEARALLAQMKDLRPATQERLLPNPSNRMADGFKDPAGTYRGDLINKSNPTLPVHPNVSNPDHANFPHYNIKFSDGTKAAIIITGRDRNGLGGN